MSTAWRWAESSSAPARANEPRPCSARSVLRRQRMAASTVAPETAPSGCAAAAQTAAACARAGATASAAATATARKRIRTAQRADRVGMATRGSAGGPRGGVPGMPTPSTLPSPTHKRTVVLRLAATVAGLDEPVGAGPHRRLQPVAHADLAEDVAEVALHRLGADPEAQRDLLVRHAGADEREHLTLAVAEVAGGSGGAQVPDDSHGHARRQRRLARGGRADAGHELVRRRVLEQVADGARVERGRDVVAIGERSEDDDLRAAAVAVREPPRGLDAADARHLEVHEHDVRLALGAHGERLLPVAGEADDLDDVGVVLEQLADPDADDLVVVGD